MAQKVKFKRKTTAEIEDLAVEDGSLIYNVDNGKTYMDYGNDRIQTGGNADTMIAIGGTQPTDNDIKIWIEEKNNQDYDTFNYRNSTTSDWELLNLPPTGDTLPVGAIVEYSGSEVPYGWEQYSTGKIRKTTQSVGLVGKIASSYTTDSKSVYNAPYVNGDVLYNDPTGSNASSIKLSANTSNYRYIEIFYRQPDNYYRSEKVYNPNNKMVNLVTLFFAANDSYAALATKTILISGTTIKNMTARNDSVGEVRFSSSGGIKFAQVANIYITRVVGYK